DHCTWLRHRGDRFRKFAAAACRRRAEVFPPKAVGGVRAILAFAPSYKVARIVRAIVVEVTRYADRHDPSTREILVRLNRSAAQRAAVGKARRLCDATQQQR